MKKFALALAFLASLAACAPDASKVVPTDYNSGSKTSLDVQSITLVDRSGLQPSNSPYNTNNFKPTIADAIHDWMAGHLQATGTSGEAMVIIKDATLTAEPIPYAQDFFTRQQASRYVGHAEVVIEVKGRGNTFAIGNAEATRFQTLPENPTDLEKQNAYTIVLNGLMRDLSQNVDNSLRNHMQGYAPVSGSPVIENGVGTGGSLLRR